MSNSAPKVIDEPIGVHLSNTMMSCSTQRFGKSLITTQPLYGDLADANAYAERPVAATWR